MGREEEGEGRREERKMRGEKGAGRGGEEEMKGRKKEGEEGIRGKESDGERRENRRGREREIETINPQSPPPLMYFLQQGAIS